MFSKLAILSCLAILAVATPMPNDTPPPTQSCDTGPIQCCQSTSTSSDASTALLLALLGIVGEGANVPIGLTCSPITGVGLSGSTCDASPVCCENNSFNGVVAVGCTPINIAL